MELHIRKSTIRNRNGYAYIDCQTNYGRLRFSAGVVYSKESLADIASSVKEFCISFLQGQKTSQRAQASKQENLGDLRTLGEKFLRLRCSALKPKTLEKYRYHLHDLCKRIPYDLGLLDQNGYDKVIVDMPKPCAEFFNRLVSFAKECDVIHSRIILFKPKKLAPQESQVKPLNLQEAEMLLRYCDMRSQSDQRWLELRNYLGFAIFSGSRVGEILALEPSDVDLENDKVYISKSKERYKDTIGTTKTGKARYIDLLENAKIALESQILIQASKRSKKHNRLFDFHEKELMRLWLEALSACGLDRRVLYQTRHSFATIMLVNGEEPLWISAMLGHSSLHTTFTHYVKYIPQKRERAKFVGFRIQLCGINQ